MGRKESSDEKSREVVFVRTRVSDGGGVLIVRVVSFPISFLQRIGGKKGIIFYSFFICAHILKKEVRIYVRECG